MDAQAFISAFGLILLMEMGDKTQLAVLSLTATTGRAGAVLAGAILGLAGVTLLGVTAGALVAAVVPGEWLSRAAGVAFIVIGLVMLWTGLHGGGKDNSSDVVTEEPKVTGNSAMGVMLATLGLLFVAELGDKSQLAVITLTASSGQPVTVFLGATAALAAVSTLGVFVGTVAMRFVPVRWLSIGAAVLFILIGVLTLAGVF